MDLRKASNSNECQPARLALYIDGELSTAQDLELERHLSVCPLCSAELVRQRQFLCALSANLENEADIDLPVNFAKIVATNAETSVSGLRRPQERFNAAFISSGLVLIMIVSLGADSGNALGALSDIFEKAVAVGSFLAHAAYDLAVGVIVILRSISLQFLYGSPSSAAVLSPIGLFLYVISRMAALLA